MAVPWNTEENPELQLIRSLLKQIIRRSLQIDHQFDDNQQHLKNQRQMYDLSLLNNQSCTNNQQNTKKEQLRNNQLFSTNQHCLINQQRSVNQQSSSNQESSANQQHSSNQHCSANQQYLTNQQNSANQQQWTNEQHSINQKSSTNQHLSTNQQYSANQQNLTNNTSGVKNRRGCCGLKYKVENVNNVTVNPSSQSKKKMSRKLRSARSLNVNQQVLISSDCPASHPSVTDTLATTDPNMVQLISDVENLDSSLNNDPTTQLQERAQQVSSNISGRNQQLKTSEASDRKRRSSKQKTPSRTQQQLLETRKGLRLSRLNRVSDNTYFNSESERQKYNLPDLIPQLSPAVPNSDQGSNPSLPDLIPRSSTPKQSSTFRLHIFQTAEKNSQFQKTGETLRNIAERFEEETRMMNERDEEEDGVRGYTRRRDEDVAERRNILLRTLFRSRDILDIRDILISTGLYFILRTLFNKF